MGRGTCGLTRGDGQGQIWSSGDTGKVYKWEGQTPQAIPVAEETHSETITGLCEDGQGRIWVGTSTGRFGWIGENHFIPLDECGTLLQDQDRVFWVGSLLQDRDGVLWMGLYGEVPALYCYEDDRLRPADMAEAESIAYVNILWEYLRLHGKSWKGLCRGLRPRIVNRLVSYFKCYVFQSFRVFLKDFLSAAEFLARNVHIIIIE